MDRKLRHEGYEVGDLIRAYDFMPIPEREDRYIEGVVEAIYMDGIPDVTEPYSLYVVRVTFDSTSMGRERVFVPMETSFAEFDNRVSKVEESHETDN